MAEAEQEARRAANRYRTFWRRVGAGFVDGLVLLPVTFLFEPTYSIWMSGPAPVFRELLSDAIPAAYTVILHARCGQTLGKMVTGVTVLDVSESRLPTLLQAALRDIGEIVIDLIAVFFVGYLAVTAGYVPGAEYNSPAWLVIGYSALAWFIIEVATMLTNGKRRALHDFIAGTVVVRVPRRLR
ncbi:MAG TPA: RDD family protein [Usitatibacter sp.]|nr:RDD family protein [Usitatibacter sp.]